MIVVHYIESAIAHKRGYIAFTDKDVYKLKGYKWDSEIECPFSSRKGAFVKPFKYKKKILKDAYFFL